MTEAIKNKKIVDTGEFIAGARKDWHINAMTRSDVDAMTDEEIILHVKKDNVWPKPDYEKLVEGGMTPTTAALIKLLRDQFAQQPRAIRGFTALEIRKTFVDLLGVVKELAEACRTPGDVSDIWYKYDSYVKARNLGDERYAIIKGRANPFYIGIKENRAAKDMVATGWPAKENDWKKNLSVKASWGGQFALYKSSKHVQGGFETEEAAWEWAKENSTKKTPVKKKSTKIEPTRPHLEHLERGGLSFDREGRDISPEDFIEAFGFRGVQFGNWLPNGERQQVLNLGYEALMDLSEILGWEPKSLSLDGTLGIAFGARGNGRAAAHYEPGQRVINMTKLSGAGSLAHEFAHAIDHWLGTGTPVQVPGGIPSATGWHHHLKSVADIMPHRDEPIVAAFEDTMSTMVKRPRTQDEALERLNKEREKFEAEISKHEAEIKRIKEKGQERTHKTYLKKVGPWLVAQNTKLSFTLEAINAIKDGRVTNYGNGYTDYFKQADALCGSSDYYRRPNELFARAFESWVFDEIRKFEGASDYLVHGVEEDRFSGEDYKGNPYPVGEEREAINGRMREIAETVRPLADLNLETGSSLKM